MRNKKIRLTGCITFLFVILIATTSAITIKSIIADTLQPGQTGEIRIELKNNLNDDVEDVSFILVFENSPFTPLGSSENSISELDEGDTEDFAYKIKARGNIAPGDYDLPYILSYNLKGNKIQRKGTIGIYVTGSSDLIPSVSQNMPVIGMNDKLSIKITNKGIADARFVNLKIIPDGYTLLSEDEVYIGNVDSDDFETADFQIRLTSSSAYAVGIIEYRDINNKLITQSFSLPLKSYSKERAIELGIIKKSNIAMYIALAVALIIAWFIIRAIRKRRRMKIKQNSVGV